MGKRGGRRSTSGQATSLTRIAGYRKQELRAAGHVFQDQAAALRALAEQVEELARDAQEWADSAGDLPFGLLYRKDGIPFARLGDHTPVVFDVEALQRRDTLEELTSRLHNLTDACERQADRLLAGE